ncbi:hypothetical protein TNCT_692061 [Trichonephila clavata]|uniref:Uncharacterized protein n=1 Tax=Trichonephila clavata TaxID=2740835 RepID=A0A8X6M0V2_TRICU|nr:hypothetical protein TNCT_692061 [Trichonephila clavata]
MVHAKRGRDPSFPASVHFHRGSVIQSRRYVQCTQFTFVAYDNPYSTRSEAAQHHFAINMWAGIIRDCSLGP